MSVHPVVSEAEARKRERAAFIAGVDAQRNADRERAYVPAPALWDRTSEAARLFPPLKVTRPRVVVSDDFEFRANQTCIEWRPKGTDRTWTLLGDRPTVGMRPLVTSSRVALFADLFARPTEEVDE